MRKVVKILLFIILIFIVFLNFTEVKSGKAVEWYTKLELLNIEDNVSKVYLYMVDGTYFAYNIDTEKIETNLMIDGEFANYDSESSLIGKYNVLGEINDILGTFSVDKKISNSIKLSFSDLRGEIWTIEFKDGTRKNLSIAYNGSVIEDKYSNIVYDLQNKKTTGTAQDMLVDMNEEIYNKIEEINDKNKKIMDLLVLIIILILIFGLIIFRIKRKGK